MRQNTGFSRSPGIAGLEKDEAAVLLIDHQSGLCNIVGDFSPDEFKDNVLAVADAAKYFDLTTILTTSFENGPNGPLVLELKELFPAAPPPFLLSREVRLRFSPANESDSRFNTSYPDMKPNRRYYGECISQWQY